MLAGTLSAAAGSKTAVDSRCFGAWIAVCQIILSGSLMGTLATGTLLSLTCKSNGPHTFPPYLGTLRKGDSIVLGKRFIKTCCEEEKGACA